MQCVVLPEIGFTAFGLCIDEQTFCDWISKGSQDKDILCYQILNRSQDTDICLLVDTGQMTDQITGQIAGYSGQIKLPVKVARSD